MRTLFTSIIMISTALLIFGFAMKDGPETKNDQPAKVEWLTFTEAVQKSQKEKKKIFIDVYTDWCGWCKRMDASTFSHPDIIEYLNENYYAVKLDAEMKDTLMVNGKEYKFIPNGRRGYHELAASLLNGRMSYPTVVFLDENFNMLTAVPGYRDAKGMEPILTYFAENKHQQDVDINEYITNYKFD